MTHLQKVSFLTKNSKNFVGIIVFIKKFVLIDITSKRQVRNLYDVHEMPQTKTHLKLTYCFPTYCAIWSVQNLAIIE